MTLSGWGRFPRIECNQAAPRSAEAAAALVKSASTLIARGNGRAYGDAALNARLTMSMARLDRLIDFDHVTGLLTCEAGTLLVDIVRHFVPRGWFVPVTPGTKFVTVGGMIAADVHGKNHHGAGSFGRHVVWLDVVDAEGHILRCDASQNSELFEATLGGMGLTGVILRAAFRLIPIETDLVAQTTLKAANLEEAMDVFEAHADAVYSVAWIDCVASGGQLGRSLITIGDHVRLADLPAERGGQPFGAAVRRSLRVPIDFPGFALNRWSVKAFNELYYRRGKDGLALVPLDNYFYPLDSLTDWNRIYGANGFVQYQFVLPKTASREGLRTILSRIAAEGSGSFLAVLKLFGPGRDYLSFPKEGYTLALDFPATISNFNLLTTLDSIVGECGGRIYLAKDARSSADLLRRGYPGLAAFEAVRAAVDPHGRFASLQSRRLGL